MLLLEALAWLTPQQSGKEGPRHRPLFSAHTLTRCSVLLASAAGYVALRSWLAVDQLVSIYRKVWILLSSFAGKGRGAKTETGGRISWLSV